MRELGYVCLRCRIRLLTASWTRPGFQPTTRYTTAAGPVQDTRQRNQRKSDGPNPAAPRLRKVNSKRPQRGTPLPDRASTLAMFQSIVNKKSVPTNSTPTNEPSNISLVKNVAQIQTILERPGATVLDAYAFFNKTIYPQLCTTRGSVPQVITQQLADVLFPKLAEIMAEDFSPDLPTVSHITHLLVDFDIVRRVTWGNLVIALVDSICRLSTQPTDYTSIEAYDTAMARRKALLHDLLAAWKAFIPSLPEDMKDDEAMVTAELSNDSLPPVPSDTEPQEGQKAHSKSQLVVAFCKLFPGIPPSTMVRPFWAALATSALLNVLQTKDGALWQQAQPFLETMKQPLANSKLPPFRANSPTFEGCPTVLDSLLKHFLKDLRNKKHSEWRPTSAPVTKTRTMAERIHKEIAIAVRKRNVDILNAAWTRFWGNDAEPDAERLAELQEMGAVFDYFAFAFMSLRQTESSLNVWNSMVRHGIQPTIRTWTSMIQGCTNSRNLRGLKIIWARLVASGTQLDTAVWTARISGLIMCGEIQGGIAALEEMAQVWRDREEPQNKAIAVKPSVESVNAVVSWLLPLDRLKLVMNVLAWAAKQGIQPDTYTFNIMLRPLVRQGKTEKVREVLHMMKSLNVNADAATFTILVESALTGIGALPPQEQVDRISHILGQFEGAGLKANMQHYGKMIYILLEESGPDSNGAAVNAVLSHIWSRGLELSTHIYTMLAEHYFSRDPPDPDAVTKLIENRRLRTNRNIDRVFWERVIKGYCQVGDTEQALEIFQDLFSSGSTITFSTMYELLVALGEAGQEEHAKAFVKAASGLTDAEDAEERANGAGKTVRYWRHRFWHRAEQMGLMEEGTRETFHSVAKA